MTPNKNECILMQIVEITGSLKENERMVLSSKYDCTFCRDGILAYVSHNNKDYNYQLIYLGRNNELEDSQRQLFDTTHSTDNYQLFSDVTQKYQIEKFPVILEYQAGKLE